MLKQLKKILDYLSGEQRPEKDVYSIENSPVQSVPGKNNADMDTRVIYQYPKANFRFPLIPDEESSKKKQQTEKRRLRTTPAMEKPLSTKEPEIKTRKIESKKAPNYQFKSTEVPSPIYGFRERMNQESETIIEFELHTDSIDDENKETIEINEIEHGSSLLNSTITSKDLKNESLQLDVPSNEYTSPENIIHTEEHERLTLGIDSKVGLSTSESENMTELLEEKQVEEKEKIQENKDDYRLLNDENIVQVENDEEKQQSASKESSTASRHYVPFNVVMLKQDRQNLEKKKQDQMNSRNTGYQFPPLHFLTVPQVDLINDENWIEHQRELLNSTLLNFSVKASVVNVTQGPSVTRFEVHPEPGVKVNKITNLSDDIKLALSAKDIRMEAPIPGKNTIGIEVPNKKSKPVFISEIIKSNIFQQHSSPLTVALGFDISGKPNILDLKKMPHGLIAGATGSGKSVCINAMLVSLLYKASPHEVKLLLIDPKMVELAPYNDIPHLVSPVITDVKAATAALKWAVEEMDRRYERFVHSGVRDIGRYNELVKQHNEPSGEMPYLVIVIDELADLMMVAPGEVEESICRIAQKARACGIHLLVATQRPSVDVITGLLKANIPTRIAFSVSSQVDSRTIIDTSGAEKLLGKGDMLLLESGSSKSVRLQGNFVSDEEIEKVVSFVKQQQKPQYLFEQEELISKANFLHEEDELFPEACEFVVDQGGASSSSLQRRFRIGYNRAARLIEMMEQQGIVSEQKGSKPRDILITEEELIEINEQNKPS
jgi:DNA segregation ATPase FtsK/SpoIIIE, S-DNA-T family